MIMHGDCLELLPTVADGSVDMVFADLPYGVTANKWDSPIDLKPLWAELLRVGKRNAAFVFTATQPFATALINSQPKLFRYDLVWRKGKATGFFNANKMPMRNHETMCVFYRNLPTYSPQMQPADRPIHSRGKKWVGQQAGSNYGSPTGLLPHPVRNERCPYSVVDFACVAGQHIKHPTQKPVALLEWLIRTYSNPGDTVLDPTMGSGTTGVACINTGRQFIGIEKDATYFETAQRRIAEAQPPLTGVA